MAITVGDAVVKFVGDRSKLNQDLNQSEKDTKDWAERTSGGVKGAFGKIFSVAGGILAAGLVQKVGGAITGMFRGAIDYGGDATETMGKFEVTFGAAADSLEKRLAGFGVEAGRSRHDLIGMAADFGAVLKGMSLTSDMAAEYSGNLAELAVDVGSFMNAQSPEVMEKFRSAMTGEYESLKSLGIVINQASVEQELLNMGIRGGAKAATEAQLVQARYNLILQKTKDAQGDAIRTSGSWANIQVRLGGIWRDFLTDVGMGTTTALAPMMGTVAKLAGDVLPKLASVLTGRVLPALGNLVSRGLGAAKSVGELIGEFREMVSWTREMGGGTEEVARNLLALGLQKLGLDLGQSQQVFAVIDSIQGFAERLAQSDAAQTLRDIGQAITNFWTSLTSGDWQGALSQLLDLPGLFGQLRDDIVSGMFTLGQELLTAIGTAFPDLKGVIDEWLRPLFNIGETGFETLGQIKSGIVTALQTAFSQITTGDFGGAAETIGLAIQNAVGLGVTWFQENVEPFAQKVWMAIQSGLAMAWSYMQAEAPILAQQLGESLNAAITQGAAWVGQNVAPLAEQLWAAIKTMASNAFARGQELAGEYGPKIGEALGNAYKAGIDWIKANVATYAESLTESLFEIQKQAITPGNAETAGAGVGEFLGKVVRVGLTALAGIVSTLATLLYEAIKGVITGATGEGGREAESTGIVLKFFGSVLDGFITGLTGNPKWAEALGQWFVDMSVAAVERIEGVVGDWVSAGESLVLGLIDGVKAKAGEIANAAKNVVLGAIRAAKAAVGIKSPSRLAASELGEPLSEGIAEGIANGAGAPASALAATLGAAIDLAKQLLGGLGEKDAQKLDILARGVNTLAQALAQFAKLEADGAKMPNLEVWGAILYAVIMRVIEVVQHVRKSIDDKLLKELAGVISSLGSILSLTRAGGVESMRALTEEGWVDLELWGARLFALIVRVIEILQAIRGWITNEGLATAVSITDDLGKLLFLIGVSGIKAVQELVSAEWPDLDAWGQRLYLLFVRVIEVLQALRGWISDDALEAAASIRDDLSAITFLIGVSGIKAVQELVAAEWPDLDAWGHRLYLLFVRAIEVIQAIRGWISDEGLEAAAGVAEYLQKIVGLLATAIAVTLPDLRTWHRDVQVFGGLLRWAGEQLLGEINQLGDEWRGAEMGATTAADRLQKIVGLLATAIAVTLPDLKTWHHDVQAFAALIRWVGEQLLGEINQLGDEWREAEMPAMVAADNLRHIVGLLATAIAVTLPNLHTWRHDVQVFATLLRWAGQQLLSSLNQLGEEWREADMPATVAADNLRHITGLLAAAIAVTLPDLTTWRWSVQVFGNLLRWAGEQLLSEINKLGEDWFDAEMVAAVAADNLRKITGLLGINLAVSLPRIDMRAAIAAFIEQLKDVGPMLKEAIETLRAEFTGMRKGVETDLLPEAAEAAGQLQDVFGFLSLINLFETLQTQRKVKKGEYRTALSNVIANFILELKNSTPILQAGLQEVEALWGDMLDDFLGDEGIVAKLKELFEGLGGAIQSAVGIGEAEISTAAILKNLQALYNAISQINNLPPPALPALPAPEKALASQGDDMRSLADMIGEKITESIIKGRGVLEVHMSPDLRAEFSDRMQNLEIQVRNMSNQLAAKSAG